MTEFLVVAAFLLVPLLVIVPVVAKIISQDQDVELAGRYAAWERTVWYESAPAAMGGYAGNPLSYKSDSQIASEVDQRIFAQDTSPVLSSAPEEAAPALDPFARRPNGDLSPLVDTRGSSTGYANVASNNSAPDGLAALMSGFAAVTEHVTDFEVRPDGVYDANASVDLVDLSDIFGTGLGVGDLRLASRNAIFAESWQSAGRAQAEHRISGLVPQDYLDLAVLNKLRDILSVVPNAKELHSDCLIFGYTTVEPLPDHRLADIDGSVRGGGGTSCSY